MDKKDFPPYDFARIEPKWRDIWEKTGAHIAKDESDRPKYYCLDMFPYPSGEGLHVGHWRGYVLSDVWSRYKKLCGYNVLHPMGWDSFGLPAENDAILKGIHPKVGTARNIANMKRQLKEIGSMFDWTREINTSDPKYYRWTQWIFLQMYKNGLAYRKMMPVNWCPNCKTGLANEEVIGGVCDRCGAEVTKKDLMQWMLRITKYADRLLEDLDKLDWPERVKILQANWIGRSEGAEVKFKVLSPENGREYELSVFTTRPDTLFGATYMVLAPEHPLVEKITSDDRRGEVGSYVERAKKILDVERASMVGEKTGVFTGAYAVNPVNGEKIPVWISDYVLMSYGTGAIMAVPAHDERDFEFAKQFDLPIVEVIKGENSRYDESGNLVEAFVGEGVMINSGRFNGMDSNLGKEKIVEWLEGKGLAKKAVNYRLRDWIFSRQRYWGEPIPIVYCDSCGEVPVPEEELPVVLPDVERYKPTGTGESPLAAIPEFVNTKCPRCGGPARRETDTMPQWAGSCWYFLRYASPDYDKGPFDPEKVGKWLPVDLYVGGIEHAILHLLYARFFTKVLYDLGYIGFDEPFTKLFNQGMIYRNGAKMSKSKGNAISPDNLVHRYGTDTVRLYELFIGPPEQDSEWSDRGIEGVYRFLNRVWNIVVANINSDVEPTLDLIKQRHMLIKSVTEGLESFKFNTTISRLMEFINYANSTDGPNGVLDRETISVFIILISPFAPHIAEELWEIMGNSGSVFDQKWPSYDEELAKVEEITVVVQVNGKLRARVRAPADISDDELREKALSEPNVKKHIEGKEIKRIIVVPRRLVNVVVI